MIKKVLLLSGGLDSMGALMKVTTDRQLQQEDIDVFFLHYQDSDWSKAQLVAVRKAMPMIHPRNLYVYNHTGSDMKYPLEACIKAMQVFGSGNNIEDDVDQYDSLELIVGYEYDPEDPLTVDELDEAVQLARQAYLKANVGLLPVKVTSPVQDMTKAQIKELIGHQTFWSCIYPHTKLGVYTPCGECPKCKLLKKYDIEHPVLNDDYSVMCTKAFGI